jgi:N-acetylmuramidase
MARKDEQAGGQKKEASPSGIEAAQNPEQEGAATEQEQRAAAEMAAAKQQHLDKRSEAAKKAAADRANVLADAGDNADPPNPSSASQVEGNSTSPASTATGSTSAATETPGSGIGEKLSVFFNDFMGKFKGFFSKLSDTISGWFGKKKEPESGGSVASPANAASSAGAVTSSASNASSGAEVASPGSWERVVDSEARRLGIESAFLRAVLKVEAGNAGPFHKSTDKPVIRFESHIFNGRLNKGEKRAGWGKSKLNGRHVDGVSCEGGQVNEQKCFQRAIKINPKAAYASISMGQGQIMGFNAGIAGYSSAQAMYEAFSNKSTGAVAQIKSMTRLIEKTGTILAACRRKDFGAFTRGYNGSKPGSPLYARYTAKMEQYYNRYKAQEGSGDTRVA